MAAQDRATIVTSGGFWQHPIAVRGALCPDGARRTVRLNQSADTFFSWPGRTTIGGKSVRGFVMSEDGDYTFTPYTGGRS